MRVSSALILSSLLVLVASACGRSETEPTPTSEPAFELFLTHKFVAWGYSIAYPAGWIPGLGQRTTFISEVFEDHEIRKWPMLGPPRPVKGYQLTLSLPYTAEYYLSNNLRPEDWLFWQNMSGEFTETPWFGAPAKRFTGTVGFGRIVNCLLGRTAESPFLLCLGAPSEQALAEFMPTWEQMLASIQPVAE